MCVLISSTRYSCQILVKLKFFRNIFEKNSNVEFYENPSVEAQLFGADGLIDMTKLIAAFRNFANALKTGAFNNI